LTKKYESGEEDYEVTELTGSKLKLKTLLLKEEYLFQL
jgi:hypothetical protein